MPAHALCAVPSMKPIVLTPVVTTSDGGILVGTEMGFNGDRKDDGEAAQPTWTIKTKTGTVTPVMVTLAPGLVTYRLPDKVDDGELFDGKKVIATVTRSAAPVAKLAAPAPKKITYKLTLGRRGSSELTLATFKDVPPEAVALIVVDAKTMQPKSYGLVQGTEITVYGRGRCSALPNGTTAPVANTKVILRWVDKTGAVSADSKPITIVKA